MYYEDEESTDGEDCSISSLRAETEEEWTSTEEEDKEMGEDRGKEITRTPSSNKPSRQGGDDESVGLGCKRTRRTDGTDGNIGEGKPSKQVRHTGEDEHPLLGISTDILL